MEVIDHPIIDLKPDKTVISGKAPTNGHSPRNGTAPDEFKLSKEFDCKCNCSAPDSESEKSQLIEVLFKGSRRNFFYNTNNFPLQLDDIVVVEAENGIDMGTITFIGDQANARLRSCHKSRNVSFNILRKASEDDNNRYQLNTMEEPTIVTRAKGLANQFNLDMKVTEAEWQLDRQRLTIYFTAPQRIDFRELVKELARTFKTRIELRQISTREEAKRIGSGVGCCGLNICCTSFLSDFNHITLDHARVQQLSNNVSKLSGNCGRLKCCLMYEYETYSKAFEEYPALRSRIQTNEGIAKLIKVDIFKNISTVCFEKTNKYHTFTKEEIDAFVKDGKVMPPEKGDMDFFHGGDVVVKRDMLGEVYIVEK